MDGLRAARERKGVSQKRAAADLGINAQRYRNYEYGKREPTLALLVQMAKYRATVCHGSEEAMREIEKYFGGKK